MKTKTTINFTGLCLLMLAVFACASGGVITVTARILDGNSTLHHTP